MVGQLSSRPKPYGLVVAGGVAGAAGVVGAEVAGAGVAGAGVAGAGVAGAAGADEVAGGGGGVVPVLWPEK